MDSIFAMWEEYRKRKAAADAQRITIGEQQAAQWPEQIKVELLIPRDLYIWLFEGAVNQEPQIPVVHQIMHLLHQARMEASDGK